AARPGGAEVLQELGGGDIEDLRDRGVADVERAAPLVVADDDLRVAGGRRRDGEREGHTAVEKRDGALPGDGELPRTKAVLLGPAALRVEGRAVVADGLGDLEVLRALAPEPGEGGERRRDARQVVLAHEGDVESHAAPLGPRPQMLDHALEERMARLVG